MREPVGSDRIKQLRVLDAGKLGEFAGVSYESEFQFFRDYLRVVVTGVRRSGDAAFDAGAVGREVVDRCNKAGIYRVLVVLNLTGRLSAIDSYEIVVDSGRYGWNHRFRLAFVDANQESVDGVRFTETVAVNRWYEVRAFTDEDEALDWLLDESHGERAMSFPEARNH